jgi:hypothetical protein
VKVLLVLGLGLLTAYSETSGTTSPEIDDAVAVAQSADSPTWRGAAEGMTALLSRASRFQWAIRDLGT